MKNGTVYKYRFNSNTNKLELLRIMKVNDELCQLSLLVSLVTKPVENFYEFHIYDANKNFVTVVKTSNPFFFDNK